LRDNVEILILTAYGSRFPAIDAFDVVVASIDFGHFEAILAPITSIVIAFLALARHARLSLLVEEVVLVTLLVYGIGIGDTGSQIAAVVISATCGHI